MNAICVTNDRALRVALQRTLQASGSSVEFFDDLTSLPASPSEQVVFLDQHTRRSTPLPQLIQIIGDNRKIVILGDSLEDNDVVSLLHHNEIDHVITDAQPVDELELVVTTAKLTSGDIFGLEKYLSWGAKIREESVYGYEDKRRALRSLTLHAKELGVRRHVLSRLESVADELMMNAIYDAPAISEGAQPAQHQIDFASTGPLAIPKPAKPALLRYASDGRYLAISVQDNYGELRKQVILEHLLRARAERGAPKRKDDDSDVTTHGAGLGLYFVLSSVNRFIANIDQGNKTEVICLFDLRQARREMTSCTQSLHIFTK